MRSDMAKVIVERPRYGSSNSSRKKGYGKYLQTTPADELPRCEPLAGRWQGMQKTLNEHLGPMRRFLRSRVGRPWNKIHEELCEFVSFENAVQKHILAHVFDYVHQHVTRMGDQIIPRSGWRRGSPLGVGQMYICPDTGLLKVIPKCKRRKPVERVNSRDDVVHLYRGGSWWEVYVRPLKEVVSGYWDVWLEQPVEALSPGRCAEVYGAEVFATSVRALTREEVRSLQKRIRARSKKRERRSLWRPRVCPA